MPSDLPTDRWWTPDDLAAYMRVSPKTISNWHSRCPERLPPRIRTMTNDLRWEPRAVMAWAMQQSGAPVDAPKTGRRRVR